MKYKNQNCFFVATALIIFINIIVYFLTGWSGADFIDTEHEWTSVFYFNGLLRNYLNCFCHLSWQHVILNMLCFLVCGIYYENKIGSLKFFLLIIALSFFTCCVISANNRSNGVGFSGTNYALYGYIIVNYIYEIVNHRNNKAGDMILGAIIVALIYIAMCFNGGTKNISFTWYPFDLINNLGHYTGLLSGVIMWFSVKIIYLLK